MASSKHHISVPHQGPFEFGHTYSTNETAAKAVIASLRSNASQETLQLAHNILGDDGCEILFRWLSYGDDIDQVRMSFPRCLTSIYLNNVDMGNVGLEALVGWLERLKEKRLGYDGSSSNLLEGGVQDIHLHSNNIQGTSELALAFLCSLSFPSPTHPYVFSTLTSLNLNNNILSASFKQTLFSLLASTLPSLRELRMSITGLNASDAQQIAAYISSDSSEGRCRLTRLYASGNSMGYKAVKAVIKATQRCWTLERVEMYANSVDEGNEEEEEEEEAMSDADGRQADPFPSAGDTFGSGCGWKGLEGQLQRITARNVYLKQQVKKEALDLLRYSRLLLLNRDIGAAKPEGASQQPNNLNRGYSNDCECIPNDSRSTPTLPADPPQAPSEDHSHFAFTKLPTEIQLTILSHLAPLLSPAQQIRIFEHAALRTTLPKIILRLPPFKVNGLRQQSKACVPDPTSLGFGSRNGPGSTGPGPKFGKLQSRSGTGYSTDSGCVGGYCMGSTNSVVCQRETERRRWLEGVGCDAYDPGTASRTVA
ncbi:hypothetical protein B0H34DRAFT_724259 [Crassisporium funariophilum]|nr:hypothetical protein B0H34DRAFT_724259 [Crassisporium funariophilum]